MINRPLSPHLQVYRLPMTAVLSISHRITGVLLILGLVGIPGVMAAAAAGPEMFSALFDALHSLPGSIAVWLWIYALYFHACHGVRHLLWDLGHGFNRDRLLIHNVIEVVISLAFTFATYAWAGFASTVESNTPY
ncbi:MAG: succinate dehydrogenase, cytochrome b556 subunit [Methylococcus sp.]